MFCTKLCNVVQLGKLSISYTILTLNIGQLLYCDGVQVARCIHHKRQNSVIYTGFQDSVVRVLWTHFYCNHIIVYMHSHLLNGPTILLSAVSQMQFLNHQKGALTFSALLQLVTRKVISILLLFEYNEIKEIIVFREKKERKIRLKDKYYYRSKIKTTFVVFVIFVNACTNSNEHWFSDR